MECMLNKEDKAFLCYCLQPFGGSTVEIPVCYSHISSVTNLLLFLKVFAHQLNRSFFRYSSSFVKIVWKIADLINEKVGFFQKFCFPSSVYVF